MGSTYSVPEKTVFRVASQNLLQRDPRQGSRRMKALVCSTIGVGTLIGCGLGLIIGFFAGAPVLGSLAFGATVFARGMNLGFGQRYAKDGKPAPSTYEQLMGIRHDQQGRKILRYAKAILTM